MSSTRDYAALDRELRDLLGLAAAPIAITFAREAPAGVPAYGGAHPAPTPDGRTGAVPAGCVFWIKAADRTFATTASDHGNCSVGSLTHGFATLAEAAAKADVAALVDAGWVTRDAAKAIPTVRQRPGSVVYGPLASTPIDPDVVLLRVNGKQAMVLHDAWPGLRLEGKPQCHIVPIAKEEGAVALSVGCMLSRVRTGLSNSEMTCAIPAARLAEVIARLRSVAAADAAVAAYAAKDKTRFA